jgi:hypothetical protein
VEGTATVPVRLSKKLSGRRVQLRASSSGANYLPASSDTRATTVK